MSIAADPFAPAAAGDGVSAVVASGGTVGWRVAADGLRVRFAHWPAGDGGAGRGGVLLLNGRSEFIEKHLETVGELRRRGFAVWSLDWRGQGRSGRLLADPLRGHVGDFADYVADLDLLADNAAGPAPGGRPLLVLAHSMGAHIALRWLHDRPGRVAAAVFSAPMVDFRRGPLALGVALPLARLVCRLPGAAAAYGPGQGPPGRGDDVFAGNRLTSCPMRFARQGAWLAHDPALALGGVTWGWLRAALQSSAQLLAPGYAAAIATPTLIVVAGAERIVDNAAAARLAAALPRGQWAEIAGARHELLCEADPLRAQFWRRFDEFTSDTVPPHE